MKVFKKIMSTTVAAATLLTGMSFQVSATTYDSCDINRDGQVQLSDSVLMNKYLFGNMYMYDNSVLDVDGNSIVSYADDECISAKNIGATFTNRVKGTSKVFTSFNTSNVPTTNKSISETYVKYTYKTDLESAPYNLSLREYNRNSANLSMMNSDKPGIIGPDSRVADANSGIVYLSTGGTGFIVGDHVIATSAHCVYDRRENAWCPNVKVYLSDDEGKAITTPMYAIESHIPLRWKSSSHDKYDYALITINEDLSDRFHFNLGMPYNIYTNNDFENYTIYSTGFSQFIPDGETEDQQNSYPTPQMYTGEGKVINANNVDKSLLCYDTDITYGNSGGPVYVKEVYKMGDNDRKEIFTAISICSGIVNYPSPRHNTGPIMNAIMLKFYRNNSNISY